MKTSELYISFEFFNVNQDDEFAYVQVIKNNKFEEPLNLGYDKLDKKFVLTRNGKVKIKAGKDTQGVHRSVLYKLSVLAKRIKDKEIQEVL